MSKYKHDYVNKSKYLRNNKLTWKRAIWRNRSVFSTLPRRLTSCNTGIFIIAVYVEIYIGRRKYVVEEWRKPYKRTHIIRLILQVNLPHVF